MGELMTAEQTTSRRWLNRFIWAVAGLTLFLISSGGMVTSKGVGLAVPDWPTTFGYNMFLFPVSQWVGGIFFEHTHRLIASGVGFLTIILAIWLWRAEPRKWVRVLGVVALGAVIVQGVLGGLRVTMLKDQIGIFHACLAQAFLGLLVFIAVVRSRGWNMPRGVRATSAPVWLAVATTVLIFVQLALGATMRHQHRDLSILDFPLAYGQVIPDVSPERLAAINTWRDAQALSNVDASHIWLQMAHRFGALLVTVGVVWYAFALRRTRAPARPLLTFSSFWVFFLAIQVTLGAWTIWSNKAADIATAHVAVGATLLALGISIVAISRRVAAAAPQSAIFSRPPSVQEAHAL
ncbi:MAG TPA: COX15/CtaA family protein [Chthoniobacterales bacterium]|nr:COX15/CtaA family protein [Chthoniobacterales bacterium]